MKTACIDGLGTTPGIRGFVKRLTPPRGQLKGESYGLVICRQYCNDSSYIWILPC